MTDEERERWKTKRLAQVRRQIDTMPADQCRTYLRDIAQYIVGFAGDAGATDWPADLHLGDVIDKHIRRSPTLLDASDGYWLDDNEKSLLVAILNERIIQADKAGVPRDDSSSTFRAELLQKLMAMQGHTVRRSAAMT